MVWLLPWRLKMVITLTALWKTKRGENINEEKLDRKEKKKTKKRALERERHREREMILSY